MGTERGRRGRTSARDRPGETDRRLLGTWVRPPTVETVEPLAAEGREFAAATERGLPRGTTVGSPRVAARCLPFVVVSDDVSPFAGAARAAFGAGRR